MRCVVAILIAALVVLAPAAAAPLRPGELGSTDAVLKWMNAYRAKPDPANVPAAIRALSQLGAFKDPETAGAYLGFIAGVIGSNPAKAEKIIAKTLPLPAADQWVIVRAIAYSELPDWNGLLRRLAERMPEHKVMIDQYLTGKLPVLKDVPLEKNSPSVMDTMRSYLTLEKLSGGKPAPVREVTFEQNPELIDTLWGLYFATGADGPIMRMIPILAWSKDKDSVDKLTVGSMVKYTLASNAARDAALLRKLRTAVRHQPKEIVPVLSDVIEAAETVDAARIRKEALAAIDEIKRKGPGYKRDVSLWGQVGTGAIAVGCIVAATLGQIVLGLPCVVGGAVSSAALQYWDKQ